ncbi:isoflavone reductase-like protein [Phoenix dactylifera]|uniref:Isoflavone reductase-like protein n=1 Tax=Phoenix dactylifera TaxID=42345 RepID=A0A8B7MS56_PHODC|nr:isoflavone reductase-like protein [Phoenix dactylifera]
MEEGKKSKILIIGATGYLGKYHAEGSLRLGHPTFILVRESTINTNPEKAKVIKDFKDAGAIVLYGDLHDHESLVKAIKQVDVVFSTMGHEHPEQLASQINIISAIKEAGNVKRYFPSEYGFDVDRVQLLEPAKSLLEIKAKIRQAIRMAGIPFTFVSSNLCATYFLSRLGQVEGDGAPKDEVSIIGDGNIKVIFVGEQDIATYAIKAAEDPRTLNKILYVRPPANICSQNELISLWEKKTKNTLKRIYLSEEEVMKKIQDTPYAVSFIYAVAHAGFIKGEMTNFEIDPSTGIEASNLYSDVKYITVDECLDKFI